MQVFEFPAEGERGRARRERAGSSVRVRFGSLAPARSTPRKFAMDT